MKYKSLKVGFSRRAIIISSNKKYKNYSDFSYKINNNSCVIFGKRKNLKGSSITGIMTHQVQQRKYIVKATYLL